jgi:deoxyribodipyrimidine photo-lyase
MNAKRIRKLNDKAVKSGPIVYWMSRDQRVDDNWALVCAQTIALKKQVPVVVVFCLVPEFLRASPRHYQFMVTGLREVERGLREKNIGFVVLSGQPGIEIPEFLRSVKAGCLVTDFDPLKIKKSWKKEVLKHVDCLCCEVDAHNIVPCWIASQKQEYGAYTLRPKITRLLPEFLEQFEHLKEHPFHYNTRPVAWDTLPRSESGYHLKSGADAAQKVLKHFVRDKLPHYIRDRNDPNKDATSHLSAYLHFGQISAQRVALEVNNAQGSAASRAAFLEELIVRRELADNFCYYNEQYDSVLGFPSWAQKTLREHAHDKREYEYSLHQLERGLTHDELWNAAQMHMVKTGWMHGYLRMYWAKKILEWSQTPKLALKHAIYLNDSYELDGRDPNGYVGIAWSIGGVHDRAWAERPIFGKIRFMSYNGCKAKFDVERYCAMVRDL